MVSMIDKARTFDGKKFMWDGHTYASEREARDIGESYGQKGFEVRAAQEGNQYLVYTRRAVTEVVVAGTPTV